MTLDHLVSSLKPIFRISKMIFVRNHNHILRIAIEIKFNDKIMSLNVDYVHGI